MKGNIIAISLIIVFFLIFFSLTTKINLVDALGNGIKDFQNFFFGFFQQKNVTVAATIVKPVQNATIIQTTTIRYP